MKRGRQRSKVQAVTKPQRRLRHLRRERRTPLQTTTARVVQNLPCEDSEHNQDQFSALPLGRGAGTMQGTVMDATSAAAPGCSVKALNQATGVVLETVSNPSGFYAIKGLLAGTYTVTFAAAGMKKSESLNHCAERAGTRFQCPVDRW
jgi:hypothetical protein